MSQEIYIGKKILFGIPKEHCKILTVMSAFGYSCEMTPMKMVDVKKDGHEFIVEDTQTHWRLVPKGQLGYEFDNAIEISKGKNEPAP